jgi:hypothetical protein
MLDNKSHHNGLSRLTAAHGLEYDGDVTTVEKEERGRKGGRRAGAFLTFLVVYCSLMHIWNKVYTLMVYME